MALVEMVMPKMGESIMEGTILNWLKAVGDTIEEDEPVLEVATDKVDTEVPATHAGVLKEILAEEGEVIPVGQAIAIISTEGEEEATVETPSQEPVAVAEIEETIATAQQTIATSAEEPVSNDDRFYSPLVMNIARTENISMEELSRIPGTGQEGRVTKKDILAYIENRHKEQEIVKATPATPAKQVQPKTSTPVVQKQTSKAVEPAVSFSGNADIVEMDRMRKMIAERMVESKRISPHVTTFVEADVTNIVNWRNKVKKEFQQKEGEKITFTPIFMEAIVKAIKDFPNINMSIEGTNMIIKKDINIGMATALKNGNLIVPVIPVADQLSLLGLTKKVNDLAKRARQNKLKPDELAGGTYTVSNIGGFGNEMGTPIIMQPQVAILAIGAIKKKPVVIETEQGDVIGIRHMMFLSHSYDHRVIDGALGGMFVRRVADYLEQFDTNRAV